MTTYGQKLAALGSYLYVKSIGLEDIVAAKWFPEIRLELKKDAFERVDGYLSISTDRYEEYAVQRRTFAGFELSAVYYREDSAPVENPAPSIYPPISFGDESTLPSLDEIAWLGTQVQFARVKFGYGVKRDPSRDKRQWTALCGGYRIGDYPSLSAALEAIDDHSCGCGPVPS